MAGIAEFLKPKDMPTGLDSEAKIFFDSFAFNTSNEAMVREHHGMKICLIPRYMVGKGGELGWDFASGPTNKGTSMLEE